MEDLYEENISKITEELKRKRVRMLLPIKTPDGLIQKRLLQENELENELENHNVDETMDHEENLEEDEEEEEEEEEMISDVEMQTELCDTLNSNEGEKVSMIELLASREGTLRSKRIRIGVLASGLLENPEGKLDNFKMLLDLMDEKDAEVFITVKKLATVSLLEIFKDLLPSYHILQLKQENVRFKKETLQLQNYEAVLLRSYKMYLQKLEGMCNVLRRKRGDTRSVKKQVVDLGVLGVTCMCELLVIHPYFNFSANIANYLIPLLNAKLPQVRELVARYISQIFKEDKRGELSLTIVRKLNQFVKSKNHCVHAEMISVLLSLRIKEINLDQEKKEEANQKKLESHKHRILALSKRERKRTKQLAQVEKELLETKAEENKQSKQKTLTEIMSIVFTIYFRILKQTPNSKVLSVCLEGLAKFAHCINLDFYQDLVTAINTLMETGNLGLREQLHCIQCVFTILSGQGAALNIDSHRFYIHFYKTLLNVHLGKTQAETEIIIRTLIKVLIVRRKRITQSRLVAFVKRISNLALQLHHNGALGILGVIRQTMQLGKNANVLLDTDTSVGNGFYQFEVEEPEYCNAHCSALWELIALQRHYHNIVQKMSKNIAWGVPTIGDGSVPMEIGKLTPEELYSEFDPNGVAFNPAVPIPKKVTVKKFTRQHHFVNSEFEKCLSDISSRKMAQNECINFYKAFSNNKICKCS